MSALPTAPKQSVSIAHYIQNSMSALPTVTKQYVSITNYTQDSMSTVTVCQHFPL